MEMQKTQNSSKFVFFHLNNGKKSQLNFLEFNLALKISAVPIFNIQPGNVASGNSKV